MVWLLSVSGILLIVAIYDVTQRRHAILRNFPLLGHLRYWLETVGPELRQYIVTDNNDERPFSRNQRRWVYASAKKENDYFGFGSDMDMELTPNYIVIKPAAVSFFDANTDELAKKNWPIPCAKVMGSYRQRPKAFRPSSVVNVSAMSFGSLSGAAVEAINRGVKLAGAMQNTGEGGISRFHNSGGDLVWQIGTGYFGCREENGKFSLSRFKEAVSRFPVKAIEIKLSQGAKPGVGGMLPGIKVSREIAEARGVARRKDCLSPSKHGSFRSTDELLDFVELLAQESGLPVGIKSAVGEMKFWEELASLMQQGKRGVDFITLDGGEGGTGAGPLVFTDHVALPFTIAFSRVFRLFKEQSMDQRIVFIGSGKLGFPERAALGFSLGCDMVNVAREALMAIGCIQAQRCHTNHCPTGIATQNRWLIRGLDPNLKSVRLANYISTLRKEISRVTFAIGHAHPSMITGHDIEILDSNFGSRTVNEVFGYR